MLFFRLLFLKLYVKPNSTIMRNTLGVLGYLILIVSGVFLDAPIIALLAIPFFLIGFILLLIFHIGLLRDQKSNKVLYIFLIVLGTVLLSGVLGYAVVEYNQFQVALDRNTSGENLPFNWEKILIVVAINIIAAVSIYFGIHKSDKLDESNIILVWMPTLILVPCTLLLIKLVVVAGFWFGG